jgi:hypothetical protein
MKKLVWCAAIAIIGCGSSTKPPESPEPGASASPEASAASSSDPAPGDSAAPATQASSDPAKAGADSGHDSEGMALAKDLLKSGGRRIGWSATKKGFVVPQSHRAGDTASLDIVFTDDKGDKRDAIRICQPGECEEHLTAKAQAALPSLAARLDSEGYTSVRAIGWPDGRDELDVSSLHMKLRLTGGKLEGVREGKPAVRLGAVKPARLLAIFPVLDAKRMGIFSAEQGDDQNQVFSVLNLP